MQRIKDKIFLPYAILSVSVVITIILIAVYSNQLPESEEYPVTGELKDYAGSISISNGNFNNKSFVTVLDNKTYYITDDYQLALKNNDLGDTKVLTKDSEIVFFLSSDDINVYCLICDGNNEKNSVWGTDDMCYGGKIYRIDKENNKAEIIVKFDDSIKVLNFFKKGNWIYYISSGTQHGLFRINIETSEKERLLSMFTNKINFHDEKFYYLESNGANIASMDLFGGNIKTFWENNRYLVSEFQIESDDMYFITRYNNNSLIIRVNMKTFEEEILVKTRDQINTFNISNGIMYYTMVPLAQKSDIGVKLIKYETNSKESIVIENDISSDNIVLLYNNIYYYKEKYFDNEDHIVELIKYDGVKNERVNYSSNLKRY